MSTVHRFHLPQQIDPGALLALPPHIAHHAARVLRLEPGDRVLLFDGCGAEFEAEIEELGRTGVTVRVGAGTGADRESPLRVLLAQGVSSGEKMDFTVQKAVELGVAAVQPVVTERSVVRLSGERAARKTEHWRRVAVAACEQCGRSVLPEVAMLTTLERWLGSLPAPAAGELRLLLSPRLGQPLRAAGAPQGEVILLAGPEGGFTEREEETVRLAGFAPVRLGRRVLRTETAALAALAALQALWGDF